MVCRKLLVAGAALIAILAAGCGESGGKSSTGVASVTVTPETADVTIGGTLALKAIAYDANGTAIANPSLTWTSSDTSVASLSGQDGAFVTLTGRLAGMATITAATGGRSGSALVEVKPESGTVVVTGRVIDGITRQGIWGATVHFSFGGSVVGAQTTRADGRYTSPAFLMGVNPLRIDASVAGYVTGTAFLDVAAGTVAAPDLPLVPESTQPGGISGTVRNARDNQPIEGVSVTLMTTIDFAQDTTDSNGFYVFTEIPAGTYSILALKEGFNRSERLGIAVGDGEVTSGQDLSLSPRDDTIHIVLTWGATPSDLDAHLTGPNADGSRFHVYYPTANRGSLTDPPFAALDVDDRSSFGPETITIAQLGSGNYRYSVHDYSNRTSASSSELSNSGAKVELYIPGYEPKEFHVPAGAGTLWTIFDLHGTIENPTVIKRDEMSIAEDPDTIP